MAAQVVVVDDDAAYLRAIARLAARSHVRIALHADGESALRHIANYGADLAIVDVYMPGIDGFEVRRQLHASSPGTFVALATVEPQLLPPELVAGTRLLAKPYVLAPLLAEVAQWRAITNRAEGYQRDALIASHLGLAHNIARRLARSYQRLISRDDIESIARIGLCEAAARFDPRNGEPFIPFAQARIRGAVMDELRRLGGFTRSRSLQRRRVERTRRELANGSLDHDTDAIATALGMSVDDVRRAETPSRVVLEPMSSSEVVSDGLDSETLVGAAELLATLARVRAELPAFEARVIELRYEAELPFVLIARELKVKPAEVQRTLDRVLCFLRRKLG